VEQFWACRQRSRQGSKLAREVDLITEDNLILAESCRESSAARHGASSGVHGHARARFSAGPALTVSDANLKTSSWRHVYLPFKHRRSVLAPARVDTDEGNADVVGVRRTRQHVACSQPVDLVPIERACERCRILMITHGVRSRLVLH
jgi:hypothetical protein